MEKLEELGPVAQGVFLPGRKPEGLDTSRPEVGAETDGGQVSEIGKEPGGAQVRCEWYGAYCTWDRLVEILGDMD